MHIFGVDFTLRMESNFDKIITLMFEANPDKK
jgi:hypothetical protein